MDITFTLILLLIVFLIFYKLYSVLGFHDESGIRKKIKELRGIKVFQIENEAKPPQDNKFEIQRNKELEDKIFRELDEESKNNLSKIFQIKPEFSLTAFLSHCDFLFTEIFNNLQSKTLKAVAECVNEDSLEKLESLAAGDSYKKTLIKADKDNIKIKKIIIDMNNNVNIEVQVPSEQMIQYRDQFSQKIFESNLTISAGNIDKTEIIKWIVTDFVNL